jgi:DNA-binding MarR family transcriptional regulator
MNHSASAARKCATAILETIPRIMRVLRYRVRSESNPDISIAQFRALAFIGRNSGAMLSDVAAFLAIPLPVASKLVDALVVGKILRRQPCKDDRRCMALTLTVLGKRKYSAALKSAEDYIATRMTALSARSCAEISRVMHSLNSIFEETPETTAPRKKN